jgi:hypothetical protein
MHVCRGRERAYQFISKCGTAAQPIVGVKEITNENSERELGVIQPTSNPGAI